MNIFTSTTQSGPMAAIFMFRYCLLLIFVHTR